MRFTRKIVVPFTFCTFLAGQLWAQEEVPVITPREQAAFKIHELNCRIYGQKARQILTSKQSPVPPTELAAAAGVCTPWALRIFSEILEGPYVVSNLIEYASAKNYFSYRAFKKFYKPLTSTATESHWAALVDNNFALASFGRAYDELHLSFDAAFEEAHGWQYESAVGVRNVYGMNAFFDMYTFGDYQSHWKLENARYVDTFRKAREFHKILGTDYSTADLEAIIGVVVNPDPQLPPDPYPPIVN